MSLCVSINALAAVSHFRSTKGEVLGKFAQNLTNVELWGNRQKRHRMPDIRGFASSSAEASIKLGPVHAGRRPRTRIQRRRVFIIPQPHLTQRFGRLKFSVLSIDDQSVDVDQHVLRGQTRDDPLGRSGQSRTRFGRREGSSHQEP